MVETVALTCLVVLALSMAPALYRILKGPSIADRVIAADALTTIIMAIVVLASIASHTRDYFDAVMAMAILGFFGTVAVAKYILRGRPID